MATTLAVQLAKLRSNTVNSLDLKAQKKSHSQSLLFEARVAATQDFDTIYLICYEGFRELCNLDARFTSFARNIFSEQSKLEDRTQMTVAQNDQLDSVLEEFLGLIGGRLLLKPALKALEWLIRRFRVHENNTIYLTLSFLPYHTAPIFPTLLDILPPNLPPLLKFLHPYVQSRANPPRHTMIYTAAHNQAFFAAMNTYTLKVSRKGHHHHTLLSFWSTVTTEAVAAMLDQSRSGRREAQKQVQEDVMLRVIPFLNKGFSLGNVPDLRVGCYMILTVLASKVNLDDEVLCAMMESTVLDWSGTTHAGLICLAVLTQQKQTTSLPGKVFKALMAVERLDDDLLILKTRYKVGNLVLGVLLGIVDNIEKAEDTKMLGTFRSLIEADLMTAPYVAIATKSILSAAHDFDTLLNQGFDLQGSLGDLILRLADSSVIGDIVQEVIRGSDMDLEQLEISLQRSIRPTEDRSDLSIEDVDMEDADKKPGTETFDTALRRIPTRTAYEISFLSHSDSYVFPSLAHAFLLGSSSPQDISTFSDLAVIRRSLAMTEPLFISFFVRIWCGNYPVVARSAAIGVVSEYLKQEKLITDVQVLLPYMIHALADPSAKVRRASAELFLVLAARYEDMTSHIQKGLKPTILGQEEIYGQGEEAEVSWITTIEAAKFVNDLVVPSLEECVLDPAHLPSRLSDILNGPKHAKDHENINKELRTSLRAATFSYLCSHVVNTPLFGVKDRLLQALNQVPKVGNFSRTKLLSPLLEKCMNQSQSEFEELCRKQGVDPGQLIEHIVSIVAPSDRDGMHIIQTIIRSERLSIPPLLYNATAKYIKNSWPLMKADVQSSLAKTLLDIAIGEPEARHKDSHQAEAIDLLRSVDLPASILLSFIEELPLLSVAPEDKPSVSKRRRTNHGHSQVSAASNPSVLAQNLRKITFVLELIETSKPERHPSLLKGLFRSLADIQRFKHSTGTELGYLQVLILSNTLAVLGNIKSSSDQQVNRSAVRADVLIDCIRTTTSPQVQHTALLLVSRIAIIAPDLILHSVMPVFTYMGANVLLQNDEYSAFVVRQTMESVIPRLVQSLHTLKGNPLIGISELLLSFVAAYEHIPSQRRLGLFVSLAEKLGPGKFLYALLVLLKDKYPSNKKVTQFAVELASHYEVKTQFSAVEQYLDVVLDILQPKPTSSSCLVSLDKGHTPESIVANLLLLPSLILSAKRLTPRTAKILNEQQEEAETIRATYGRLLEQIFILSEKTKHNRRLRILCEQLLHALLALFSISEFVGTLQALLDRTDHEIRRQILNSFERRLNVSRPSQRNSQQAILAFLPQLSSLIEKSSDLPLKHTAVACIDRIVEQFGKKDVTLVATTAMIIAGPACLGVQDNSLRVMALLCLATMVEISEDAFLPVIPQALPKTIDYMTASIKPDEEDERLHKAALSFTTNFLLYVPWALSGPSLDRFLTTSHQSANAEIGEECDLHRVDTLKLVAKQVEPKELFAALDRTWARAMTEGPIAVKEHLLILRLAISYQSKSSIPRHSSQVVSLLLKCFDLRRIQYSPRSRDSYEESEVEDVEDAVNETAITMIYKLNDTNFRPLFLRMMEWATALKDGERGIQRRITWWTFLGKFFKTLKSIVSSYASFIIEDAVEILNSTDIKDSDSRLLWQKVISTLQNCFEHDQDDFWQSPSHFTPISAAILASFPTATQSVPVSNEKDLSFPTLLTRTITALAAATADTPNHHKSLNTQILNYLRSDSAAVRLLAVACERALTDRLGEEWLGMLPEMLPLIAEGLEDDDEGVEADVKGWVRKIEEILGEKLDDMLK